MSKYQLTRRLTLQDDGLYRLQVWVSQSTDNLPCAIFAWQTLFPFPDDPEPANIFVHVCKYTDLITIPDTEPDPEDQVQLYRRSFFDLVSKDKRLLEVTWRKVMIHTRQLVEDVVRLNGDRQPMELGFEEVP